MRKTFAALVVFATAIGVLAGTQYREVSFSIASASTSASVTNSTTPATLWIPVALYATYASNGIPSNVVTVSESSSVATVAAVIDSVSVASNATAVRIDFDTTAVISAREVLTITRASDATNGVLSGWVLFEVSN